MDSNQLVTALGVSQEIADRLATTAGVHTIRDLALTLGLKEQHALFAEVLGVTPAEVQDLAERAIAAMAPGEWQSVLETFERAKRHPMGVLPPEADSSGFQNNEGQV